MVQLKSRISSVPSAAERAYKIAIFHRVYIFQVVTTVMGTGDPRDLTCTNPACSNGQAVKQKLLAPKALASAPDGAIYVADYNLIRKITPDGLVSSLLKLK